MTSRLKIRLRRTEGFRKDYQRLPRKIQRKVDKQLRLFAMNSKHPSLKIHRMDGTRWFWEFYIDKNHGGYLSKKEACISLKDWDHII